MYLQLIHGSHTHMHTLALYIWCNNTLHCDVDFHPACQVQIQMFQL